MQRFERVLDLLPKGHVFDGELVVLDDAGRPLFNELLFGRRRPTYVAFDLLIADGIDLRPLPLKHRKAMLARVDRGAELWIALTNGIVGEGRALYRAVVEADLGRDRGTARATLGQGLAVSAFPLYVPV
jgi:ATP-dependent DNA ligase